MRSPPTNTVITLYVIPVRYEGGFMKEETGNLVSEEGKAEVAGAV